MRIQNDRSLFLSDAVNKQFKFIVSHKTAGDLMTSFMMNKASYKSLEIDYVTFPIEANTFEPTDVTPNNPKVVFIVYLHDDWYDKLLKKMYNSSRKEVAAGVAFEFSKN